MALFDLSLDMSIGQLKFFAALCMSVNDHESVQ